MTKKLGSKKMKKLLLSLFVLLIILIGGVWGLFFTRAGNEFLRPGIEALLNQRLPVPVRLQNFSLLPLDITLFIGKDSQIKAKGEWSLLDQSLDISYDIHIARLEELEPLIGQKLKGPLHTWGKIFGKFKNFAVQGESDLAKSQTKYNLRVQEFEASSLFANMKGARVEDLLFMANRPKFATGIVDAKAAIEDLELSRLKGRVQAILKGVRIDRGVMRKNFGVHLPKTTLRGALLAQMDGSHIFVNGGLNSNLLRFLLKGKSDTKSLSTHMNYDLIVKELALLRPLTKIRLRGPIDAKGTITGDKKALQIGGVTHMAGSSSRYKLILKNFKPASLQASIHKAQLAKILYMLTQPRYADGVIDSTIKLDNLDPKHLQGSIITHLRNGHTFSRTIQKIFDIEGADITFRADQKSLIHKGVVRSDIDIDSSIAQITSRKALYTIDQGSLKAKYLLTLPDLSKLRFITHQKMRGTLAIDGEIKKDKDFLLTAHSDTLGGKITAKLLNDKLQAHLKNIEVVQLTHMLYYPEVFDSSMNADLEYNIATKKGELAARAYDGHILPNQLSFLLQQMANFDITKEIYKVTELNSSIEDKQILSNLDMKSRFTHISSHKALVDLAKKYIDAKLRIDIKHRPLYVKLQGALDAPKISIDAQSLFKERAKKELQKRLKDKVPKEIKGLLNNLF